VEHVDAAHDASFGSSPRSIAILAGPTRALSSGRALVAIDGSTADSMAPAAKIVGPPRR
jgi:hypothetical protein